MASNYEGGKEGIGHLIEKGYSEIAFVTVDLDQIQMHQREKGYRETLRAHRVDIHQN